MSQGKILLITPDFPPNEGGVARYLQCIAEHIQGRIEVLTEPHPAWQSFDTQAGYPIFRSRLLSRFLWPRWLKMVKYLWQYRGRYDLILTSHVLPVGSAAWIAKTFTGVPYAVMVHGMDVRLALTSGRKRWLATNVLKNAQLVVANSQALAQELAREFGINEILVVYPCISPSSPVSPAPPSSPFCVLTVSRLVERKGHQHVLNALAHLRNTGQLTDFVYHIVGEGPMESTLKSMVDALVLNRQVIFHGRVSDQQRKELYAKAHIFVMPVSQDPLDKEGFGLAYIEAASAGVPSIATRVEGVDEAVIDGQTGFLLPSQDEQQLANAILTLAVDGSLREQLGVAAREHAKNFLCQHQMKKLDPYISDE
jgi:phosphatidylinositol alpha-1,6-mannosyltransferase